MWNIVVLVLGEDWLTESLLFGSDPKAWMMR